MDSANNGSRWTDLPSSSREEGNTDRFRSINNYNCLVESTTPSPNRDVIANLQVEANEQTGEAQIKTKYGRIVWKPDRL